MRVHVQLVADALRERLRGIGVAVDHKDPPRLAVATALGAEGAEPSGQFVLVGVC